MTIKKKLKIIIPIIIVVLLLVTIGIIMYSKIKSCFVFEIKDAFFKVLDASSVKFDFEYKINDEETVANGNLEYDIEDLIFIGNATSNKGDVALYVSKGNTSVGYYFEKANYWFTIDATDIGDSILNVLDSLGEKSVEESFPIQTILTFFNIDEKVDISNYPNKLTKGFMFEFIKDSFLNDALEFEEKTENGKKIYSIEPDVYNVLYKFVKNSNMSSKDKKEALKDLEKNKEKLKEITLKLSVSVDENGYLSDIYYYQDDKENIESIKINLHEFNETKVDIQEEVLNKLKEE